MKVQMLGCSHNTAPIAVRERLSFNADQSQCALDRLRRTFPKVEVVILSTCNRVELYTATENGGAPARRELAEFVARFHRLDPTTILEHLYDRDGEQAVRHLFVVASSLDSMVLGEPQILSQVKQAYRTASQNQATGPLTHAAFQTAIRVARRVSTETTIHERRVSIPSVAVADFARQIFERFDDKETLVLGAGEMAEETLKYLTDQGARRITVINRNPRRALQLARRWRGEARPWHQLSESLSRADLVISTTGAEEPIVGLETFKGIEAARNGKPMFVLDLAVPRDFEPAIGSRPGVYLYAIDDLQAACERNRHQREKELPAAMRIIEQETQRFMTELNQRAAVPIIKRLREGWHEPKEQELQRLLNKLPDLDERARREIGRSFDRLINKLLHPPLESIRVEARQGIPSTLLDAAAKLFQLKD